MTLLVRPGEPGEVAVTRGVMNDRPGVLHGLRRPDGDVQKRNSFRVTARDPVDGAEFAHAGGGQQRTEARDAGVGVRGVGGTEFGGGAHPFDAGGVQNFVQHGEVVVTGHPEHMGHAQLSKATQQVARHGHVHTSSVEAGGRQD